MEWTDLIGRPFQWAGRGAPGFDCWGLVRECYIREGCPTPEYDTPEGMGSRIAAITSGILEWEKVERAPGAMVLFILPTGMKHVGYCVDANRFIHCWEGSGGVCVERLDVWKRRTQGFYRPARREKISHP